MRLRLTLAQAIILKKWKLRRAGAVDVDTTAPTVTGVAVQTGLTVDVTFSEPMGTGVTTAANYTVSGTGEGTLSANPDSVALVSGNKYRCTWNSGKMLNGGNITIAVANAQDTAGNAVNSNGTHTGGAIGTAPTVAGFAATSPSGALAIPITTFTASEAGAYFIITESSTPPAVDAAGWNLTAPTTYTVAALGTVTLYPWVKDAAGNVSSVYGSPVSVTVTFTDSFDRADGDLANGWEYTAGKWTIASGAALGTPAEGSNLFVNGGFDADTNWIKEADWTIGSGVATKAAGAATRLIREVVAVAKNWYRFDWTITVITAGSLNAKNISTTNPSRTTAATFIDTGRATGTSVGFDGGATTAGSIDNVSIKLLTLADMFCTRDFLSSDIDISVPLTLLSNTQGGLVICLDSKTTPANFIIAYQTGNRIVVDKCVAGTYTELIGTSTTYGAGQILRLRKVGTTVQAYYNGLQISTDKTVSDAGIISNTRHGAFSTHNGNTFASLSASLPT